NVLRGDQAGQRGPNGPVGKCRAVCLPAPVEFQNSAISPDPGFYATRSYSLMSSSELLYGSVHEESFGDIWNGDRRRRIVETIEERFCSSCPGPCYAGFPSPLMTPPGTPRFRCVGTGRSI